MGTLVKTAYELDSGNGGAREPCHGVKAQKPGVVGAQNGRVGDEKDRAGIKCRYHLAAQR